MVIGCRFNLAIRKLSTRFVAAAAKDMAAPVIIETQTARNWPWLKKMMAGGSDAALAPK